MIHYTDIAVVGAGPAGEAAAAAAAGAGAAVVVIAPLGEPGAAELTGTGVARATSDRIQRADATVVSIHRTDIGVDLLVAPAATDELLTIAALSVVIANGARDIGLDLPGSDLAGILGAREALGATRSELTGRRVVVAGTGPLVVPLAARLTSAGVRITDVITANENKLVAAATVAGAQRWLSGSRDRRLLRDCGTHVTYRQAVIAVQGDAAGRVAGVVVAPIDPSGALNVTGARLIEAEALVVTAGQAPAVEFAEELGLATDLGPDGRPFIVTDSYGRTGIPAVTAAGDVAGSFGVEGAQASGRLAGLAAAVPVFGIATKVGRPRELRHGAGLNRRLRRSARAVAESWPLIVPDGIQVRLPPDFRVLPTTLGALAQLDVPDRDVVLDAKESRLSEHFALAAGEPALSSVIFDNIPE